MEMLPKSPPLFHETTRRSFLWMGGTAAFVLAMGIDRFPVARPSIPVGPKTFYWTCNEKDGCLGWWDDETRWSLTPGGIYIEGAGVPGQNDSAVLNHDHVMDIHLQKKPLILNNLNVNSNLRIDKRWKYNKTKNTDDKSVSIWT